MQYNIAPVLILFAKGSELNWVVERTHLKVAILKGKRNGRRFSLLRNVNSAGKQIRINWTSPVLDQDTDCSTPPEMNWAGDRAFPGHGQLGYVPDYSWLKYKYRPAWSASGRFLKRDNPKEYSEAWSWLSFVMGLCNGNVKANELPSNTPSAIQGVLGKWRPLNTTKNVAIHDSEKHWEKAPSIKKLRPSKLLLPKTKNTVNYWKELNQS